VITVTVKIRKKTLTATRTSRSKWEDYDKTVQAMQEILEKIRRR